MSDLDKHQEALRRLSSFDKEMRENQKKQNNNQNNNQDNSGIGCFTSISVLVVFLLFIGLIVGLYEEFAPEGLSFYFRSSQNIECKYDNGQTKEKYFVKKDSRGNFIKHGLYQSWHQNGMLEQSGKYKFNKLDGALTSWDQDGKKYSEVLYRKGDSKYIKTFYDNGQLQQQAFYKYDLLNGVYKCYNSDGSFAEIGTYMNDNHHGFVVSGLQGGKALTLNFYQNGELLPLSGQYNYNAIKDSLEGVFKSQ